MHHDSDTPAGTQETAVEILLYGEPGKGKTVLRDEVCPYSQPCMDARVVDYISYMYGMAHA